VNLLEDIFAKDLEFATISSADPIGRSGKTVDVATVSCCFDP